MPITIQIPSDLLKQALEGDQPVLVPIQSGVPDSDRVVVVANVILCSDRMVEVPEIPEDLKTKMAAALGEDSAFKAPQY